METLKIFGERLRALRDERHLRQADMAEVLQITLVHYQRMEYGKVKCPIADALLSCGLLQRHHGLSAGAQRRAGVNPFRAPVGATALGGPMVWPPLERVREVTNRPWKFGPPSGGHGGFCSRRGPLPRGMRPPLSSSQSPLSSVSACGENCARSLAPPLPTARGAAGGPFRSCQKRNGPCTV
mgnify:CR=1 FL=1